MPFGKVALDGLLEAARSLAASSNYSYENDLMISDQEILMFHRCHTGERGNKKPAVDDGPVQCGGEGGIPLVSRNY